MTPLWSPTSRNQNRRQIPHDIAGGHDPPRLIGQPIKVIWTVALADVGDEQASRTGLNRDIRSFHTSGVAMFDSPLSLFGSIGPLMHQDIGVPS